MSISFAEAVDAVWEVRAADWAGTIGTLYVSPRGYQDDEDYLVEWGAREHLLEGLPGFVLLNGVSTFVNIETGTVHDEPTVENLERIKHMTPVTA